MLAIISNNPLFLPVGEQCAQKFIAKESSHQVLLKARDMIHLGWEMLHHPLYGNFRPYQQPYRTVLLQGKRLATFSENKSSQTSRIEPDLMSLHLIEQALLVYNNSRVIVPDETPELMRLDCAKLDLALLETTLSQAGLTVPDCHESIATCEKLLTDQKDGRLM